MHRRRAPLLVAALTALVLVGAGCGDQIDVPRSDPAFKGAVLFSQRCSGCHTLGPAGAQGSRPARTVSGGERTNGPNLNTRPESMNDVLFAIRNGGFSGAIMPANVVVGSDARAVAMFVSKYAGRQNPQNKGPGRTRSGS